MECQNVGVVRFTIKDPEFSQTFTFIPNLVTRFPTSGDDGYKTIDVLFDVPEGL